MNRKNTQGSRRLNKIMYYVKAEACTKKRR